jgi:uncharacterized delta-60 repeat protein
LIAILGGEAIFAAGVSTDTSFNATVNGPVTTIAVQSDGKVLIGGMFTAVNGASRPYLARLNADGSLDAGFGATNGPAQYVSRVQFAGSKIYVSGGDGIRRYDSNGALDWIYPMQGKTFAVDSQQRVVIGGQFTRVENQPHRNIARLTANGTLDSTFLPQVGCCAGEGVFAVLSRGDSVLVGGAFQIVNETNVAMNLALIAGDGAVDPSFLGTAPLNVLALAATPDGGFLRVNDHSVARHLANGALDTSFSSLQLNSPDEYFLTAAMQPDGTAVVGGAFAPGNVVRLNDDGSVDSDFGIQTDGAVQAIANTPDGGILLGGSFHSVNGSARGNLVKLTGASTSAPAPVLNVSLAVGGIRLSWQASAGSFSLETKSVSSTNWSPIAVTISSENGVNSAIVPVSGVGNLFRLSAGR